MSDLILNKLFSLKDRVAVVTGGSGVLGGAMAKGLALAGARVVVLGRNEARASAVVADITANGGESMAVLADVRSLPIRNSSGKLLYSVGIR